MVTFWHIKDATDCAGECLYDGEENEDADIVAKHPKHEDGHQYL